MLRVVVWKWKHPTGYRSEFGSKQVNIMRNMVKRNLKLEHEFICITDDPQGIDPDIRIVPLWEPPVSNFGSYTKPNCFVRIRAFSKEMLQVIGDRFVWLDLDAVIVGDITPLFDNQNDFMMWGDTNKQTPYNGSMVLMNAGARDEVWTRFDPEMSPNIAKSSGFVGSDQAWIAHILGPHEKRWTREDGVFSFKNHFVNMRKVFLPPEARIVFFHGEHDPWHLDIQQKYPWVVQHYR